MGFLRRYYSIYDDDKGLVGLVRSIHPDEAATSTLSSASQDASDASRAQQAPSPEAARPTPLAEPPTAAGTAVAATLKDTKVAILPLPLAFLFPVSVRDQVSWRGERRLRGK